MECPRVPSWLVPARTPNSVGPSVNNSGPAFCPVSGALPPGSGGGRLRRSWAQGLVTCHLATWAPCKAANCPWPGGELEGTAGTPLRAFCFGLDLGPLQGWGRVGACGGVPPVWTLNGCRLGCGDA